MPTMTGEVYAASSGLSSGCHHAEGQNYTQSNNWLPHMPCPRARRGHGALFDRLPGQTSDFSVFRTRRRPTHRVHGIESQRTGRGRSNGTGRPAGRLPEDADEPIRVNARSHCCGSRDDTHHDHDDTHHDRDGTFWPGLDRPKHRGLRRLPGLMQLAS